MKITRHNYESFLIDYLDGSLDESTVNELLLFLEQNPDIKNEFEDLDQTSLPAEEIKMPRREELKKEIATEFDTRCIAYLEGDLNTTDAAVLEKEVSESAEKARLFRQYSLARLKPDLSISFPDKAMLKKAVNPFRRAVLYTSFSAAAGLLLIAGFFALNSQGTSSGNGQVLALAEIGVTEHYAQYPRPEIQPVETHDIQQHAEPVVMKKKVSSNAPEYKPEFVASQIPDKLLQDESDEQKKIKNDNRNKKDTTENLIIPNEILLKQNEKKLADNSIKKFAPAPKQGFVYYLEQGVKGFKSLTGKNVDMNRKIDENGKTREFAFNIGKFKVSHTKGE